MHLQIISQSIVPVPLVQRAVQSLHMPKDANGFFIVDKTAAPVWSGHPMPDTEIQNNS